MDDIGWNDLGFVNPQILTPNIDKLATKQGLLLTHFYTAKECAPTRGALMTGRAPYHFGYYRNPSDEGGVPLEYKLLPEILGSISTASYATHAVGKWHVSCATHTLIVSPRLWAGCLIHCVVAMRTARIQDEDGQMILNERGDRID